jgi:hypothetical protein
MVKYRPPRLYYDDEKSRYYFKDGNNKVYLPRMKSTTKIKDDAEKRISIINKIYNKVENRRFQRNKARRKKRVGSTPLIVRDGQAGNLILSDPEKIATYQNEIYRSISNPFNLYLPNYLQLKFKGYQSLEEEKERKKIEREEKHREYKLRSESVARIGQPIIDPEALNLLLNRYNFNILGQADIPINTRPSYTFIEDVSEQEKGHEEQSTPEKGQEEELEKLKVPIEIKKIPIEETPPVETFFTDDNLNKLVTTLADEEKKEDIFYSPRQFSDEGDFQDIINEIKNAKGLKTIYDNEIKKASNDREIRETTDAFKLIQKLREGKIKNLTDFQFYFSAVKNRFERGLNIGDLDERLIKLYRDIQGMDIPRSGRPVEIKLEPFISKAEPTKSAQSIITKTSGLTKSEQTNPNDFEFLGEIKFGSTRPIVLLYDMGDERKALAIPVEDFRKLIPASKRSQLVNDIRNSNDMLLINDNTIISALKKKYDLGEKFYVADAVKMKKLLSNPRMGAGSSKPRPSDLNKPLYDTEVISILAPYRDFHAVCMRNELDPILAILHIKDIDKFGIIMNLSPNTTNGSHWVAIYGDLNENCHVCYYDPFGDDIGDDTLQVLKRFLDMRGLPHLVKIKINKIPQQQKKSNLCGFHSARFLIEMFKHGDFKKATDYDVRKNEKIGRENEIKFRKFGYL